MRILVTGANGFLGRGIVDALLSNGHDVIAAVLSDRNVDPRCEVVKRDILTVDDFSDAFGSIDCVFHLAWKDGFVHSSDEHIRNLPAHCSFIQKCVEAGVKRILIMGSMHEVGYYEGGVSSKTPCFPLSNYGIAKNALRDYSLNISRGTESVIQWLRGFYIVGNTTAGASIFSKIAKAAQNGEATFPFTSGKTLYDFLGYEEFARLAASFVSSKPVSGIYNIGSGHPESLASRVERFIADNGFNIKLAYGAFPDRPYDSPGIWADMTETLAVLEERADAE